MSEWRQELAKAMFEHGENFPDDILSMALEEGELDWEKERGRPGFTAWTRDYVYFPACYDHLYWVASVPRNPNGVATYPVGG